MKPSRLDGPARPCKALLPPLLLCLAAANPGGSTGRLHVRADDAPREMAADMADASPHDESSTHVPPHAAPGEPPDTAPVDHPPTRGLATRGAVEQLVEQLAADRRADRLAAERGLLDLGPAALVWLPAADKSSSAAVRESLEHVRRVLEHQAAREALEPTRITLQTNAPISVLAATLARQAQTPIIVGDSASTQPLAVDWSDAPLWNCLADLERLSGLRLATDRLAEAFVLVDPSGPGPVARTSAGPCRIELLSIDDKPNLTDPTRPIVQVRCRLWVEPRLRPLFTTVADADLQASLRGQPLAPLSPEGRRELPLDRWAPAEWTSNFVRQAQDEVDREGDAVPVPLPDAELEANTDPGAPATSNTFSLSGRIVMRVAGALASVEFSDPLSARPQIRRRGDALVTLRSGAWDAAQRVLRVELSLVYDRGGTDFESHRQWLYDNPVQLVLLNGAVHRPGPGDVELLQLEPAGALLAITLSDLPPPAEWELLRYEAPLAFVDLPVEFDLE